MGSSESDAESEARMVTQVENNEQQPTAVNAKDQNHVMGIQSNIKENGDTMKANKRKLANSETADENSDEEDFAGFDAVDPKQKSSEFIFF